MRYRLIAIDLDGTLLNAAGQVSRANRTALERVHRAGALVVPCTGRSWRESAGPLGSVTNLTIGVFITGAVVTDLSTGQSSEHLEIEPALAAAIVDYLNELNEAVLIFRDADHVGHDYLVSGSGKLSTNSEWWFRSCQVKVCRQEHPPPAVLHHCLRIGIVSSEATILAAIDGLAARFGQRVKSHYFRAIETPGSDEVLYVLEIFAVGVDKWRGLDAIARRYGIDRSQIAAIGDGINDLGMLQNAGCSIAMENGVLEARQLAGRVTADHNADGVAIALEHLLCGRWG